MEEFITIQKEVTTEIVEKKSKFIANLFYVESVKEAEEKIKEIKKKHFNARHNCIAYRIVEKENIIEKFNDDGEPTGTAGTPMLNILQKKQLVNVLIIVTRYFGGTLLGTGGLVRAYSNSLLQAIEKSKIIKKSLGNKLNVVLDYSEFENFKYYCRIQEIQITDIEYKENVECKIELKKIKKEQMIKDYERKKINLIDLQELSQIYIEESELK